MTPEQIMTDISRRHRVGHKDLVGPSRFRHMIIARQEAAKEMRGLGLSLPAIGRWLHRDHTTILHHLGGRTGRGKDYSK